MLIDLICFGLIDLTGQRFGRWVVIAYAGGSKWLCVCDCGTVVVVWGHALRTGDSKSCGCLRDELISARSKTHGMTQSREFQTWASMLQRCANPNHPGYAYYGGRGISVCEEWRCSFLAFFADMGERPPGCTLDRIDVNGNYEPGNCRWATAFVQTHNRRPLRTKRPAKKRRKFKPLPPPPLEDPPF
jgi:hypothetical protein